MELRPNSECMPKRKTNLYRPDSKEPFNLSRSKIDFFLECPRCFYLDRKFGITRPSMPGWSLNSAVDILLKNEFDLFRERRQAHHLMMAYQVPAIPFWHENLYLWRDDVGKKTGAMVLHEKTNLMIHGIIDDLWQNTQTGELHVVDYKSTSMDGEVSLNGEYKIGYKRQIEIYQWIFRKLGFKVSDVGYFVYANGLKGYGKTFNDRLEFKTTIIPYIGDDSWVEPTILEIKNCLDSPEIPSPNQKCEHCGWKKLIDDEALKIQKKLI